jgi:protein-S-isoprenylcysteine O-methyltransferase Ste14
MNWSFLIEAPWLIFVVYWLLSAFKTKRTQKKEPFAWRYGVMLVEALGFALLSDGDVGIGVLGHRIFPRSDGLRITGAILIWAGIALAIWARWHLGQYWSGRVSIKEDHKLIRTGPYVRLRHPIYSGLDLAAIGTALEINRWRCAVAICVIIAGFAIKAKREESMLSQQFGPDFQEHRRQTGFLLPHF